MLALSDADSLTLLLTIGHCSPPRLLCISFPYGPVEFSIAQSYEQRSQTRSCSCSRPIHDGDCGFPCLGSGPRTGDAVLPWAGCGDGCIHRGVQGSKPIAHAGGRYCPECCVHSRIHGASHRGKAQGGLGGCLNRCDRRHGGLGRTQRAGDRVCAVAAITTVEATAQASLRLSSVRSSVNTGMNAALRAVSATSVRNRLGTLNATVNAPISAPSPR